MLGAAPDTVHDAKYNMYCFSKDAETKAPEFKETAPCPPFPPMTGWHGWIKIDSADLPWSFHRYRDIEGVPDYEDLGFQYAIVYEYVMKSTKHDIEAAQGQIDFFYAAGFLLYQFRIQNWNQGRLVDFGDLFRPMDRLDPRLRTSRRDASVVFAPAGPPCLDAKSWTEKRKGEQDEGRDGSKRMRAGHDSFSGDANEVLTESREEEGGDETAKGMVKDKGKGIREVDGGVQNV